MPRSEPGLGPAFPSPLAGEGASHGEAGAGASNRRQEWRVATRHSAPHAALRAPLSLKGRGEAAPRLMGGAG